MITRHTLVVSSLPLSEEHPNATNTIPMRRRQRTIRMMYYDPQQGHESSTIIKKRTTTTPRKNHVSCSVASLPLLILGFLLIGNVFLVIVVESSVANTPHNNERRSRTKSFPFFFHSRRRQRQTNHNNNQGDETIKIYKDPNGSYEYFVLPASSEQQQSQQQQQEYFRVVQRPDFDGLDRQFDFGSATSTPCNIVVNHDPALRMNLIQRSSHYGEPYETLGRTNTAATANKPMSALSLSLMKHQFQTRLHERTNLIRQLLLQQRRSLHITATNVACMCGHQFHMIEHKLHDMFVVPHGLPSHVLHAVSHRAHSMLHNAVVVTKRNHPNHHNKNNAIEETADDEEDMFILDENDPNAILTTVERKQIVDQTLELMENVNEALSRDDLWEFLIEKQGVKVWRTYENVKQLKQQQQHADSISNNDNKKDSGDSATIRSEAILNASPKEVYDLFMDNNRVHEYNDNCVDLYDIEYLDRNTKLNWCATGKFGMFKPRDFITIVHFNKLSDGSGYMSLAANMESGHPKLPELSTHVRSEIQLSATFMKVVPNNPNQTRFIQLTQVGNLGGVADNPLAQRMAAKMAQTAPIDFITKFDKALQQKQQDSSTKKNNSVVNVKSLPFYKPENDNNTTRRRIPGTSTTVASASNKDFLDV